jgi:TP901 family phage tail tape measure protein
MAIQAAELIATISVIGAAQAQKDLAKTGAQSEAAAAQMKGALVSGAMVAGVAVVALAAKSVQMAGDFQSSMTRLVTSAGESQGAIGMVSQGILKMAVDTGTSTEQLAAGMYYAESAGYHAAAGLQVMGVAARGAKSENADLDVVAKALTTTMVDYHMKSSQAADAMNGLIATVQNGKTNLQDLAASMGAVLPIASALHISFPQVAGSMDTMTNAGMSAENASQNLAHVLVALQAPSKVAMKSMDGVGLSAQQVRDALVNQGLPEALQLIEEHVGQKFPAGSVAGEQALKNIMGGLVGVKLAAMLTGDSLNTTKANIEKITAAMKNGNGQVMGWSDVQKTFNFQIAQAGEVAETLGIKIGTALLPIVGDLVSGLSAIVPKIADWMSNSHAIIPVLSGLGAMLATILIPAAWSLAAGVIAATWPFIAIGAAVAGAIAILIQLNNTFPPVHQALASIQADFTAFGNLVSGVFDAIGRKAAESTLQAKISTINNTIAQQQGIIASYENQKQQIEDLITRTTDTVERKTLEAKLKSIDNAEAQSKGVIAAAEKQKKGVEAQLASTDPVVALHTLKQKDTAVSNSLIQAQQTVSNLARQKQGIEQELAGCTDATKKHSLEMQLAATEGAQKQAQGVVKSIEGQKQGIEKSMQQQKNIMQQDAGGNALIKTWQNIQQAAGNVGAFLGKYVMPILQQIGTFLASQFTPVWKQLTDLWNSQLLPLFKQMQPAFVQMLPLLQLLGIIIGGLVVTSIGILISMIAGLAKGIAYMIEGLANVVTGIVRVFTGIAQVVGGIVQFIVDLFTGKFGKLGADLGQIGSGILNIFVGLWQAVAGVFQAAWGLVSGIVGGFVQEVIGFFQKLFDELVGHSIIPDMLNSILQWFTSIPQKILGGIQNFVSMLLNHFGELKSEAIVIFESIVTGIGNALGKLGGLAQGAWNTMMSDIKTGINGIIGLINNFINGIDKLKINIPGGQTIGFSIPNIPYLAAGGLIGGAGMAVVGDDGPEQVWLPQGAQVIPNGQSFGGGQQPIIVQAVLQVDGRLMTNGLMPHIVTAIRTATGVKF